jgi:hypothetical protein
VRGASELPNLPGLYFVGVTIEDLVPSTVAGRRRSEIAPVTAIREV